MVQLRVTTSDGYQTLYPTLNFQIHKLFRGKMARDRGRDRKRAREKEGGKKKIEIDGTNCICAPFGRDRRDGKKRKLEGERDK